MSYSGERALRVEPAQFSSTAEKLGQSRLNTETAIAAVETLTATYANTQQGPDIVLLGSAVEALVVGFRSSIAGFEYVGEAFDSAHKTLTRLETDSDELWWQVSLADADLSVDDDIKFRDWFDDIRRQEEAALSGLSDALHQAPTGDDVKLPPGTGELVNRLIASGKGNQLDVELTIAKALLADYAEDGDFDVAVDLERSLRSGDFSATEVEWLMSEGVDREIRNAILDGVTFPDGERFSDVQIRSLLFGELDPDITLEILKDSELGFPGEDLMESMYSAMGKGRDPIRVDIDKRYFPSWYVAYIDNERNIQAAERRRDDVDGVPLVPDWLDPSDRQGPRISIEEQLAELQETKNLFEEKYGIGSSRQIDGVEAAAMVGERLGGHHWKGTKLADLLDFGGGSVTRVTEERQRIISEIDEHPESSIGFFNTLGPEKINRLAFETKVNFDHPPSLKTLSVALGASTRYQGIHTLNFDGTQLVRQPGAIRPKVVEDLLTKGHFDEDFWVDATVAALEVRSERRMDNANPLGNQVLSMACQSPKLVVKVIEGLEGNDPKLEALLNPGRPYLGQEIAAFLTIGGDDRETAGKVLAAGADVGSFKDPGTAAGIDAIMAKHVTVLYDEQYLGTHGVVPNETGRLSQEEMGRLGFGAEQWNALSENVNQHGFGGFAATGNEQLMFEAMQNGIKAEGGEGLPAADFERFAYVSGVLNEQEFQARLEIANENDESAKAKNQRVQIGAAVASALTVAGTSAIAPVIIPEALVVGADIAAGTGISMFFPEFWETGEAFEVAEESRQASKSTISERQTQGRLAWLQATGEEVKLSVENSDQPDVTVSVVTETVKNPDTGVATTRPVMRAVDHNGDQWKPEPNESLDWGSLSEDAVIDGVKVTVPHSVNQSALNALGIVGEEQGFNEAQAQESGIPAPAASAENSYQGVSPTDRKAVDRWLGLQTE